jgi:hypothetical protein
MAYYGDKITTYVRFYKNLKKDHYIHSAFEIETIVHSIDVSDN